MLHAGSSLRLMFFIVPQRLSLELAIIIIVVFWQVDALSC
jgi:hypothetical protein